MVHKIDKNYKKIHIIIATTLIVLTLVFIFSNSAKPAVESAETSRGLASFLTDIINNIFKDFTLTDHIIRKTAHFCEFALLGFEAFALAFFICDMGINTFVYSSFFALLCALSDETIQVFTDGRGPSVTDVWLDFSGVLTGILFSFVITEIIIKSIAKRRKN